MNVLLNFFPVRAGGGQHKLCLMNKPIILFNASTNVVGGAIQTATNFITLAKEDQEIDWYFTISSVIYNQLVSIGTKLESNFTVFETSPAKDLQSRKKLKDIERRILPDIIYTMSGPAYVRFKNPHVLGCSNGFVTHANWDVFVIDRHPWRILKKFLRVTYQAINFRKADYWVFQTEVSRRGFVNRLKIKSENTFVVSNAYGRLFKKEGAKTQLGETKKKHTRISILVPSAAMEHKNLELVPKVAGFLKEKHNDFQFVFTLPQESQLWTRIIKSADTLGVTKYLVNNGPFSVADAPKLYRKSDIVFLPTLLETFSAVYIESMVSKRPLVTTDKGFARDICGKAALYFRSDDPHDAANQIFAIIDQPNVATELLNHADSRLELVPSAQERYNYIKNILLNIIKQ